MTNEEIELQSLEEKKKKRKKKRKVKKKKKGKKDACYHKVRSRYDVWPSAYASGALVKCRKVGASNWGNKSKKNESLNEEFKSHMMYDPKTGKSEKTKIESDHVRLAKKGYTHVNPKDIEEVLRKEGGASGLDPFLKAIGKDMKEEIIKTIEGMPNVGQHKNKDYILHDSEQVHVKKETMEYGQMQLRLEQLEKMIAEEISLTLEEIESLEEKKKKKKKKPCKKAKGKRYVKRVNGRCRSFGQAGKAKGGGDRIRPGTKKGDAYCARSAKIKKCKNPPCANDLSRKKWKCRGSKSMKENNTDNE